jgi:hypothetical protein
VWRRFLALFAVTLAGALLGAAAAIALIDPLAISPVRVVSDEILPQTDRRYIVPAIVRGRRYDSFIVGSSTVHSLDPRRFDELLAARFANVSLFASTPYEQTQVLRLIVRETSQVRVIVWGLDLNWCTATPPLRYSPLAKFPDWLYDDDKLGHLTHAFNWSGLERSQRKLRQFLRRKGERVRNDGYLRIMPPESAYDVARLRRQVYGAEPPRKLAPVDAPTVAGSSQIGGRLPGVAILADAVAVLPPSARVVFIFMPQHAMLLPAPGTSEEKLLEDCKTAVADLARRRRDWVLDAMWRSIWTVEDHNFWDPHHYRDHIAEALAEAVGSVVRGVPGSGAPIRVLARGRW